MKPLAHLRILVVEDDPRMVELLRIGLLERGHAVVTASTSARARGLLDESIFDAVVLDIGLPDSNGYSVVDHLRDRSNRPAIVMLTAFSQEDQVVCGLDAGADDYLSKPFSFPELVARIASAVRRTRTAGTSVFPFGPFHLDISKHRLFCDRREVHLTRSEFLLLRALALRRGEIVPRRQLMQAVWGTATVSNGSLDTLVNSLREKLDAGQAGLLSTVRGSGYSLVEESELPRRDVDPVKAFAP
jgi:DNA-binding response OmpR family regulator